MTDNGFNLNEYSQHIKKMHTLAQLYWDMTRRDRKSATIAIRPTENDVSDIYLTESMEIDKKLASDIICKEGERLAGILRRHGFITMDFEQILHLNIPKYVARQKLF